MQRKEDTEFPKPLNSVHPVAYLPLGQEVTPQNVGEFLLFAAKNSTLIRAGLVKALVAPGTWIPHIPEVSDAALVMAIRVMDLALSQCGGNARQRKAGTELRSRIVDTLGLQIRPPLLAEEMRGARTTISAVARFFHIDLEVLRGPLERSENDRDILKKAEEELRQSGVSGRLQKKRLRQVRDDVKGKNVRQPKRGRRFSERQTRKLAAIALLVGCGQTKEKAREDVSEALRNWSKDLDAESLRRLESRYRNTCRPAKLGDLQTPKKCRNAGLDPDAIVSRAIGRPDAFIVPEKLPSVWLQALGDLLMFYNKHESRPEFVAELFKHDLKQHWQTASQNFLASKINPQSETTP